MRGREKVEKGNGLGHVLKGTVGYARRERWRGSKMIQLEADNLGGILPKIAYALLPRGQPCITKFSHWFNLQRWPWSHKNPTSRVNAFRIWAHCACDQRIVCTPRPQNFLLDLMWPAVSPALILSSALNHLIDKLFRLTRTFYACSSQQ